MKRMKIGQQVTATPESFGDDGCKATGKPLRLAGEVIYVHPKHRFYVLEFTFTGAGGVNRIREAFPFEAEGRK